MIRPFVTLPPAVNNAGTVKGYTFMLFAYGQEVFDTEHFVVMHLSHFTHYQHVVFLALNLYLLL